MKTVVRTEITNIEKKAPRVEELLTPLLNAKVMPIPLEVLELVEVALLELIVVFVCDANDCVEDVVVEFELLIPVWELLVVV